MKWKKTNVISISIKPIFGILFLNDRRKRVEYQLEWRSPQTRVVCPQWPRTVHTAG